MAEQAEQAEQAETTDGGFREGMREGARDLRRDFSRERVEERLQEQVSETPILKHVLDLRLVFRAVLVGLALAVIAWLLVGPRFAAVLLILSFGLTWAFFTL